MNTKERRADKFFDPDFDEGPIEEKLISPWQAKAFVENLNIPEEEWDGIMQHSEKNHEIRGLIYIAQHGVTRTLSDVYQEQYPDGNHNSLGDIEAEQAAARVTDRQWQEFACGHEAEFRRF